jgi:CheY-like chemotaxis protein
MKERILIVDDSPENIESARETISTEAYDIVTATGYKEAVDLLDKQEFDWVMTDLYMPPDDRFLNKSVTTAPPELVPSGLLVMLEALSKPRVKGVGLYTSTNHSDPICEMIVSMGRFLVGGKRVFLKQALPRWDREGGKTGKDWGNAFGDNFWQCPDTGESFSCSLDLSKYEQRFR